MSRSALQKGLGVTLIEVLVGAMLLTLVGLMIAFVLRHGFEGFAHGELRRDAQQTARKIVDRLSQDLSQAVLLPARKELQSPLSVVLEPYPARANPTSGAWSGDSGDPSHGYEPNLVAFTSGGMTSILSAIQADDLGTYRIVVYYTRGPNETRSYRQEEPWGLIRRAYRAFTSTGDYNPHLKPANWRPLKSQPAQVPPALAIDDLLQTAPDTSRGEREDVVASVPYPQADKIELAVRHVSEADAPTASMFELTVKVSLFPNGSTVETARVAQEKTVIYARGGNL